MIDRMIHSAGKRFRGGKRGSEHDGFGHGRRRLYRRAYGSGPSRRRRAGRGLLDDLSTGFRWAVPEAAKLIVGDFGDAALLDAIVAEHGVDAIAHFAAKIVVPELGRRSARLLRQQHRQGATLLECAVRRKIKHFIFSSTAAVYGEPEVAPITEQATLAPINPYGRSKLMVEWMLQDVATGA